MGQTDEFKYYLYIMKYLVPYNSKKRNCYKNSDLKLYLQRIIISKMKSYRFLFTETNI